MKNLMKLLSLLILIAAFSAMQSCDDGDDIKPAPSVALGTTSASNIAGETITVEVTVNSPNGGQALVVYVDGVEEESFDMGGAKDFTQAYEYTIPENSAVGSTIIIAFQAIDSKNYPSAVANFTVTVGDPVVVLEGNLATQTLDASVPYLIKGQTFIPSGVILTIPAGTVIKGDKASKAVLVVQPGGKIMANGTAGNPVVFTSAQAAGERDRGDWGGIVILGNAWVNQAALPAIEGISPAQTYGNITSPATNASHDAGTLTYVRIEYAGIELTPNNETNSLTFGGVGSGTTIDNVQVSYGGDDGFEWFGGSVNAKHIISLSTWDDDFDTDFGWSGNVQFALAVRNPFFADQSGSNGFESDNQANANETPGGASGYTKGIFSNVTVLGPRDFTTGLGGSGTSARTISANYQNAMHIRRRSALSIFNSFFSGFPVGLRVDDAATLDNLNSVSKLAYNVLASPNTTELGTATTSSNVAFSTNLNSGDATAIRDYWVNNNNTFIKPTATAGWSPNPGTPANSVDPYVDLGLNKVMFWGGQTSSTFAANPDFTVSSGILSSGANFSDALVSGNSFFEAVSYRGAFGSTDWTDGWAEFQPLSKLY
jgi:hypothetical protein